MLRIPHIEDLPAEISLSQELQPQLTQHWNIAVVAGPHAAPDFFTDQDIAELYQAEWEVHYNSSRTGIRLIGPKPTWARTDGGEAGLHPSNIHDNAYAIGTIDFTGDMPVVLGKDGPSLGGFVCPATIVAAEFWKIGQAKAGDTVRFHRIDQQTAAQLRHQQDSFIQQLTSGYQPAIAHLASEVPADSSPALLHHISDGPDGVSVNIRQAGDRYLLVEYGDNVLDFDLRLRAHTLHDALDELAPEGLCEMVEGIRSLQIRLQPRCHKPASAY